MAGPAGRFTPRSDGSPAGFRRRPARRASGLPPGARAPPPEPPWRPAAGPAPQPALPAP